MTDPNGYSGDKPARKELVALPYGQTAAPYTCGSCHYFGRRFGEGRGEGDLAGISKDERHKYMGGGYCKFKLPPHVQHRVVEEGGPTNWCNDTDSCDLWKSSGKAYLEYRRVES